MATYNNIRTIVMELATTNFRMYPENYPLNSDGLATDEASENAQELAISYYEHRDELEVERDEKAGINKADYVDFVMDAFNSFLTNV